MNPRPGTKIERGIRGENDDRRERCKQHVYERPQYCHPNLALAVGCGEAASGKIIQNKQSADGQKNDSLRDGSRLARQECEGELVNQVGKGDDSDEAGDGGGELRIHSRQEHERKEKPGVDAEFNAENATGRNGPCSHGVG